MCWGVQAGTGFPPFLMDSPTNRKRLPLMTAARKSPQDHKAPAAEVEPFVYSTPAGDVTLPKFSEIPFGVMRRMRKVSEEDIAFFIFEELLTDEDLAVIDALPQAEVGKLIEAWQTDGDISAPESSAS